MRQRGRKRERNVYAGGCEAVFGIYHLVLHRPLDDPFPPSVWRSGWSSSCLLLNFSVLNAYYSAWHRVDLLTFPLDMLLQGEVHI